MPVVEQGISFAEGSDALGDGGAAAALRTGVREASVPLIAAEPHVTTEEARKLGIREKISTFTTRHACCAPRVTNIHTIADILDGYLIRPGETFSLNGEAAQATLHCLTGCAIGEVLGMVIGTALVSSNRIEVDVRHNVVRTEVAAWPDWADRSSVPSWTCSGLRLRPCGSVNC